MLSHAKLDVYRRAIELLALAVSILSSLPKGNGDLADQLRRASLSVSLNIAEGAGKTTLSDKRKPAEILKIVDPNVVARGNALLARVVAMLTKKSR